MTIQHMYIHNMIFFLESTIGSSYIQLLLITSLFVSCLAWIGTIYYSFSLLLSKIHFSKNKEYAEI